MIGRTLAHYEVTELLGKGGMGEVYRAHDTRLGRDVAIKVLPENIAANSEVQSRFRREAQTISSLNHPNICVLHDVGEDGDTRFLVMELVEGVTLHERLRSGPLPMQDALTYGAQIADALDRAHRAGVIHRDLKPGNVMITRAGAKLMDFGLARVTAPGSGSDDLTMAASPTVAHPLTQEGSIVGTFQYMAPEQIEGREVDARGDLWALGCVLYEMATGERAFAGATQANLIGSILHMHPEPVAQRIGLAPPEFDRLVNACLAKDPDDRLQSAHDVKLQLSWLRDGLSGSSTTVPAIETHGGARSWSRRVVAFALPVVAAVLGAAAMWTATSRPDDTTADAAPVRYRLGGWNLRPSMTPVISPDGRSVVFAVRSGLSGSLYIRDLDSFEAREIAGTTEGYAPFFSPDGRWIGFVTQDAVYKVPVAGGMAQLIASVANVNSADWGPNGWIYLGPGGGGESGDVAMYRVRADGGPVEVFGRLAEGDDETGVWLPEALPDGRTALITVIGGGRERVVAFRDDGTRHEVLDGVFLARYVEPGHLVVQDRASQGAAVFPFDAEEARVTGGAVVVTEQVDGSFCFDVSPTGLLVYVPAPVEGEGRYLTWVDRDGSRSIASDLKGSWAQPRVSPDGRRVLARRTGSSCELWMLDLDRGSFARIVQEDDTHDPMWVPDGRSILFDRMEAGEIVTMEVSGSRRTRVVASGANRGRPESWSPGVDLLAFTVTGHAGKSDVWVRPMNGDGEPEPFAATPDSETEPEISPDGRWIAYVSDQTGVPEVYVRSLPDDGSVWQASAGGGANPLWSRDGTELFFVRLDDAALVSVAVRDDDGLELGVPQKLFEGLLSTSRAGDFDVASDGRFITVAGESDDTNRLEIRVLGNWQAEVNRLRGAPR